jgi:molybdate transport system ATP-binding protein
VNGDGIHCRFQVAYSQFDLDVNLSLPGQGVIGIFGHSGSGKTTLLRCIAGLEKNRGAITVNGSIWQNDSVFLPTHRRPLAYVFQEASLLPHLSVQQNLGFAVKRASNISPLAYDDVLNILNIRKLLNQQTHQLSGGERQRVAIARSLLINPKVLLMDEPLASLDVTHKQEILPYLETLHRELTIPIIYVSHATDEVTRLADYLVVLEHGKVVADGPLHEVLSRLDHPFEINDDTGVVIDAIVTAKDTHWHLMSVQFDGGNMWLRDNHNQVGDKVRLRVLARDISIALQQHDSSILNCLPCTIDDIKEQSEEGSALIRLLVGSTALIAKVTLKSLHHLDLHKGKLVWAQIKSVALVH